MSALAPVLEAFFTERLVRQRRASPHTIAAYRDCLRMLVVFAAERLDKAPSELDIADLDAGLVGQFLDHLETERLVSGRTRNARLAAIHSLFRYAARQHPEHANSIARVLAIEGRRLDRAIVIYLDEAEIEALLGAVEQTTWRGRRDRALLQLAVTTGLRVSELTGLRCEDVGLDRGPHVRCRGKGRKERVVPLGKETVSLLRQWLRELGGEPSSPLFPTRAGGTLSRDAVAKLLDRHVSVAATACPSLATKSVTPHTLRHSCAMTLLRSGNNITVIALWLGHESTKSTEIYLHAEMAIKERALARVTPVTAPHGRYKAPDELLAFFDSL
jgi:site-specific recombinase XerD